MSSNTFRKGDASSCLVPTQPWSMVADMPDDFNDLATRLVNMMTAAEANGVLKTTSTLGDLKRAINGILLIPLRDNHVVTTTKYHGREGNIRADAYWDEIPVESQTDKLVWANFKKALARAYEMKMRILDSASPDVSDTLLSTKEKFNHQVIEPLCGINRDE